MFIDPVYLIIMVVAALLTFGAQWKVKSAFAKWSKVPNEQGLTGVDTAKRIMAGRGLEYVSMKKVAGELTDFYDPRDKSINLSDSSTGRPSVAAMAVVAHELGHAEQDKDGYAALKLRSALVPAANIGSNVGVWLIIIGIGVQAMSQSAAGLGSLAVWAGILLFALAVTFTLVTLPVEFNASARAKRNLAELGLVSPHEQQGVNAVLNAAALTYVAAAATAVLQLLYWVSRARRSD
jgi:hypothetical protein